MVMIFIFIIQLEKGITMSFNKTYFEIYAALVLCDVAYIDEPFNRSTQKDRY